MSAELSGRKLRMGTTQLVSKLCSSCVETLLEELTSIKTGNTLGIRFGAC